MVLEHVLHSFAVPTHDGHHQGRVTHGRVGIYRQSMLEEPLHGLGLPLGGSRVDGRHAHARVGLRELKGLVLARRALVGSKSVTH